MLTIKGQENLITLLNYIRSTIPGLVSSCQLVEKTGELKILTSKLHLNKLLFFLRNHYLLQFTGLQDLYAIDYLDYTFNSLFSSNLQGINVNKLDRFQVNYYLLSYLNETRCLVKINTSDTDFIESVSNLFNSAVWLEREVWDLFGIYFRNNPDLRRILTDYGFEGFALRKDFPLSGYTEVVYTTEFKKITVKPLELTQEFRVFEFQTPWDIKKK